MRLNRIAFVMFAVTLAAAPFARAKEWEFPKDWFWHDDEAQRAKHEALLGKPMPTLDLSDWKNGEVKPDDMKGKVVVVDFWSTWCGPCIAAIPHNNEMMEKYKDKGVIVLGVCTNARGQEKYDAVVTSKGIKYPSARDKDTKSEKAWGVMWYPTYAVVDRKGNVRAIGLKPDAVEKVVEKLVVESPSADASDKRVVRPVYASADKGSEPTAAKIDPSWFEGDAAARAKKDKLQGKPAPELQVKDWTNGDKTTLASLKGKVVLLDFWATWCGPCIAAIPHTNELMEKYGEQGLVIIGVCHSRGAEKMKATASEKGIKYLVAADVNGKTDDAYAVDGYPDYYFIDRAGNLRIADCKNGKVEDAIKALLAEESPEKTAAR
jgi:cytochrome c biogenesis protein CcmG, thiol:disulfide interchange protein DsbE